MKTKGVIALFRIEMHDVETPPLWSDEQTLIYLDDAQKMFARETDGIPDSTSPLAELSYSVGDTSLTLDERILRVRNAYRVSDGRDVDIINYEDMAQKGMRFDGREGPVTSLIIGMDTKTVYPYPVPTIADTLKLVIERMPLEDVSKDSVELEIANYHHLHLLDHMKALAYGNQDAEIFNKMKAVEHEGRFMKYCAKVKMEKARRKHKNRVVQYGGLPMSTRDGSDYGR